MSNSNGTCMGRFSDAHTSFGTFFGVSVFSFAIQTSGPFRWFMVQVISATFAV